MTRRRLVLTLVLLPVILLASTGIGCPKDPYRASISGSAKVADGVAEGIKVTTQYYGLGKVNDLEKGTIANYLQVVTDANMKFRHGAEDLHQRGIVGKAEYLALAQVFVNSVPTDPTTFRYINPDAQKKFAEVLGGIKTTLNLIQATIQNAKGGV